MKKYTVQFSGSIEVEASNEEDVNTLFRSGIYDDEIVDSIQFDNVTLKSDDEDESGCMWIHDHEAEPDKCEWHN